MGAISAIERITKPNSEIPVLFGHSLGGQAAAAVAGLYPNLVRGAVLEDPARFDGSGTEEQDAENARRWRSELLQQ